MVQWRALLLIFPRKTKKKKFFNARVLLSWNWLNIYEFAHMMTTYMLLMAGLGHCPLLTMSSPYFYDIKYIHFQLLEEVLMSCFKFNNFVFIDLLPQCDVGC